MNNEKDVVLDGDNLVTKSNKLIESAYKLSELEQKIILTLISLIEPGDTKFRSFTFSISDFTRLIGAKGGTRNRELEKVTEKLMSKVHHIRFEDKYTQIQWLTSAEYNYGQGTLTLTLNEWLEPYLLNLQKEFTSYRVKYVSTLKGDYPMRIYELLKQYQDIKKRTFLLDELKEIVGCGDKYPAYANFKARVLIPAQKQLKEKSNLSFEFKEIKKGRAVHKILFHIIPNAPIIKPINEVIDVTAEDEPEKNIPVQDESEEFNLFTAADESEITELHNIATKWKLAGVTKVSIKNWLKKHDKDKILTTFAYVRNTKGIRKPGGFINNLLENGLLSESAEEVKVLNPVEDAIQEFIKYCGSGTEVLPDWWPDDKAIPFFSEKLGGKKEAEAFWAERGKEIKDIIFKKPSYA